MQRLLVQLGSTLLVAALAFDVGLAGQQADKRLVQVGPRHFLIVRFAHQFLGEIEILFPVRGRLARQNGFRLAQRLNGRDSAVGGVGSILIGQLPAQGQRRRQQFDHFLRRRVGLAAVLNGQIEGQLVQSEHTLGVPLRRMLQPLAGGGADQAPLAPNSSERSVASSLSRRLPLAWAASSRSH